MAVDSLNIKSFITGTRKGRPNRSVLADVAKAAGVAPSTVSSILTNKPHCYASQATRQRVTEAAKRLNYVPNVLARGLMGQGTKVIGLIIPSLSLSRVTMQALDNIEQCAAEKGYKIIVSAHRNNVKKEEECIRELLGYSVDCIIIRPVSEGSCEHLKRLIQDGMPLVTVDSGLDFPTWDVSVDRELGGYLLVRHLFEIGRKRLAFLIFGDGNRFITSRVRGYKRACAEQGTRLEDHLVITQSFVEGEVTPWGADLARRALATGRDFDAVVASSDLIAIGAMRVLFQLGKRMPDDVAVVGFDDEDFTENLMIPLTTIRQPRDEGKLALDLLLDQLEPRDSMPLPAPRQVVLVPDLMVRESTVGRQATSTV